MAIVEQQIKPLERGDYLCRDESNGYGTLV